MTATPMYPIKISRKEKFLDWLLKRYTCRFCHKACYKHHAYSDDEELGLDSDCTIVMWRCGPCLAQYNIGFGWEKEITTIYLETFIRMKPYMVYLNLRTNTSWITETFNNEIIKEFDYLLPITPTNINQKVETILTFL